MLPIALQVGISAYGYWEMTYGEIVDTIDAYKENDRLRIREIASFNYQQANLIGMSVARIMSDKAKFPSLKEAFPNIFNDLEDKVEPVQDWQIAKARLMEYAESNNKKKRGEIS